MAGILANSASKTMASGDTSAANSVTGYITGERVTLTTTPTGSAYVWALATPTGSAAGVDLSAPDGASVYFRPDVEGTYVASVTVDSVTVYTIMLSVVASAVAEVSGATHYLPRTDASVPTPSTGVTLYYSSTQSALCQKDSAGAVSTINKTAV